MKDSIKLQSLDFEQGTGGQLAHFFYLMFDIFTPSETTSKLVFQCRHDNLTWSTLWSKQGSQGAAWRFGAATVPKTATALRFVAEHSWYNIALDAIGIGVPTVDFKGLACDFEFEGCFWLFDHQFNESTWRYVSTAMSSVPANDGSWYLQAAGDGFDNEEFIFESLPFHITEDMAVLFAYHVNGSGAVLELQHMTATANWTSLFSVLSHKDIFWQQAAVSIPSTSTALRFLARTSGSQDVILIDSLSCSNAVSSIENLSCSFEEDFCGWASSWLRYSDPMSWYDLGRQDAFHGDWYIHVDSSRQAGILRRRINPSHVVQSSALALFLKDHGVQKCVGHNMRSKHCRTLLWSVRGWEGWATHETD